MGMEKYEDYVKRTGCVLTYDPGWSEDNKTGAWRTLRPVKDDEKCNQCLLCWIYCPEASISKEDLRIDYMYCKGCGICAVECPTGAISMEKEEKR